MVRGADTPVQYKQHNIKKEGESYHLIRFGQI